MEGYPASNDHNNRVTGHQIDESRQTSTNQEIRSSTDEGSTAPDHQRSRHHRSRHTGSGLYKGRFKRICGRWRRQSTPKLQT